jgi:hypothetical protein
MRIGGCGKSTDALNLGVLSALPEPVTGRSRLTWISKGIGLPPSLGTDLNELKLTAPLAADG